MVTSVPFLIARITEEKDFLRLKEMANVHDGWVLEYDKNGIKIWSRSATEATIKMVKVWAIFSGVNSSDLYNTLMDPIYKKQWDSHVLLAYEIGYLNPNNVISYYAASFPPPLRSRDFVLQSSWMDKTTEHYMLNHSVCHKDHPPRAGYVRAISYFTGFYIKAVLDNGCEMTFVSQTDPQGFIPSWIVNKCTQIFAPRFVRQVERAAFGYRAWKSQNSPSYYPWVHPEQIKAPQISVADCVPSLEETESHFFRYLIEKQKQKNERELVCPKEHNCQHNVVSAGPSKTTETSDHKTFTEPQNEFHKFHSPGELDKKGKRQKSKSAFWLRLNKSTFQKN